MNSYTIRNLDFQYPQKDTYALKGIELTIKKGEFVTICGSSGSGKTTMLRHLKPTLTPYGVRKGEIFFEDTLIEKMSKREEVSKIGYVLQNPDNQIVTDKVWHELAFGLESLGYTNAQIRLRVAEMASFFGIQDWFYKNVTELSGGQKQLLNLASIMAIQPEVILLDEPTSQLDPIGAMNFLDTVWKINRELGITVVMTEHRLEEILTMSDSVVVMDKGKIIIKDAPREVGKYLKKQMHPMFCAMPAPMQIVSSVKEDTFPLTVNEGRKVLQTEFENKEIVFRTKENKKKEREAKNSIECKELFFRYEKKGENVIKNLSLAVKEGEFFALMGGNGTGKTTTLNLLNGIYKPQYGKIIIEHKTVATLPQNPQTLFVKKTIEEDLEDMLHKQKQDTEIVKQKIKEVAQLVEIEDLLKAHPYDLSGGEQQRAALAKVLLLEPNILFLDEPTKGLDTFFKSKLAKILKQLQQKKVSIIMVSHDIEFCAKYADRCAMFFDGTIITENDTNTFFSGNSFYTTSSNRMTRSIFENAVTIKDVIELWKKNQ